MKSLPRNIDPVYIIGGLIVAVFLALNGRENLATMQQQQQQAKAIAQQNQQAEMKARLATASSQRQAETAKERYDAGCQMVFASNDPTKFAAIQQNQPVLDATTGYPIPDGSVVCDTLRCYVTVLRRYVTVFVTVRQKNYDRLFSSSKLLGENQKMKSTTTHRSGGNNYWNPHRFKDGDRIICPDGIERSIKLIGIKNCVAEDGTTWLLKRCKPIAKS